VSWQALHENALRRVAVERHPYAEHRTHQRITVYNHAHFGTLTQPALAQGFRTVYLQQPTDAHALAGRDIGQGLGSSRSCGRRA
jgi:hypothetical protein